MDEEKQSQLEYASTIGDGEVSDDELRELQEEHVREE